MTSGARRELGAAFSLEAASGIEPETSGLTDRRSTAELHCPMRGARDSTHAI